MTDTTQAEAAFEAYLDAIEEPPFDENHYRLHTPARPVLICAVCIHRGWAQTESRDRDLFVAGYEAAMKLLDDAMCSHGPHQSGSAPQFCDGCLTAGDES